MISVLPAMRREQRRPSENLATSRPLRTYPTSVSALVIWPESRIPPGDMDVLPLFRNSGGLFPGIMREGPEGMEYTVLQL